MRTALQAAADWRAAARRRDLADTLQRLLDDAEITRRELASIAGIARAYVSRILDGEADPTLETYARLSAALGADLSTRIYPNSGPVVRDRWAAPMLEHVLATRHPRWSPFLARATRAVAAEFGRQLRAAYPAHPDDALAALTGTEAWPGPALMWMVVEKGATRWVSGR